VHLVGFITRIYHDTRAPERQIRVGYSRGVGLFIGLHTQGPLLTF